MGLTCHHGWNNRKILYFQAHLLKRLVIVQLFEQSNQSIKISPLIDLGNAHVTDSHLMECTSILLITKGDLQIKILAKFCIFEVFYELKLLFVFMYEHCKSEQCLDILLVYHILCNI